jgi:hypothetical protein
MKTCFNNSHYGTPVPHSWSRAQSTARASDQQIEERGTQPQHQSRRTMRKQHAINPKVLVGEMGFNPPFLTIESNSCQMQIKRPTPKHHKRKCCPRRRAAPDGRSNNACCAASSLDLEKPRHRHQRKGTQGEANITIQPHIYTASLSLTNRRHRTGCDVKNMFSRQGPISHTQVPNSTRRSTARTTAVHSRHQRERRAIGVSTMCGIACAAVLAATRRPLADLCCAI